MIVHDFQERNAWSKAASHEPFWYAVYKKAFPDMRDWYEVDTLQLQRIGIDRVITLSSSKQIYIDEKKRSREYNDILLEFISNDQRKTPGWMECDKAIDYLAYAFIQSKRVYLYDWRMLRRAWLHFKQQWIETYPIIEAQNNGYRTVSVAVPIVVLWKAYATAHIIQL